MKVSNWSWIEMCGPRGLVPWYPSKHDIGSCFQQLFLLVPVSVLFAVFSSYYYGTQTGRTRINHQKLIINLRFTITLLIATIPVIRIIIGLHFPSWMFRPVDYLTAGTEIIAWFVHAGYVLSLRHKSKIHGPVFMRVLWTLLVVLDITKLRTQILMPNSDHDSVHQYQFGFCVATVVLQILYGLTFLFSGIQQVNSTLINSQIQFDEHTPLLSQSVYHGFREDLDPEYLGVAMSNDTCTSKLIFHWVNPLMKKGCDGKLKTCDDLFDLPNQLSTSYLGEKLYSALGTVKKPSRTTTYGSQDVAVLPQPEKVTLFKALHICFGVEFYTIGILKLITDILAFAGPLLLNKLVIFIESKNEPVEIGYLCSFGLFLTTFLQALTNVHFKFAMTKIGIKLRGALISTVYRKTLSTNFLAINKFSVGEIANFMSIDTQRIVNFCPSFHSFWSIPLQVIVTFYLLYTQVGLAFLAGVIFTVILIPINKVIASKIGELSLKLMEQKDFRVASMSELLRGIRTLKIHVWEEYFLEKVLKIRQYELKYLKARKYLDALCVYFWATTPVLISILTFVTYSLMGNQLTAATVFTTMALLNMLIAPLNAFPWILNGLTEAWVSLNRIQKLLDSTDVDFREYFDNGGSQHLYSLHRCSFNWGNESSENATEENDAAEEFNKSDLVASENEESTPWNAESERTPRKYFILENVNLNVEEGNLVGVIGPVGAGKSTFLTALVGELRKVKGKISMKNIEGGCALVTQTPWLQSCTLRENILFGKSYDSTWYKTVLEACCLVQDLETFPKGDLVKLGEGGMTLSGGQRARVALARAVYQNKDIYLLDDILASVDGPVARAIFSEVICGLLQNKTRIWCTNQLQFLTNADYVIKFDNGKVVAVGKPSEVIVGFDEFNTFELESVSPIKEQKAKLEDFKNYIETDEEINETGSISAKVYKKYWLSVGHFLALTVFFSVILMQASRNLTDLWMSFWVSQDIKLNATRASPLWIEENRNHYLTLYIALAVMNTLITLLRAFTFAYAGIQAAIVIHEKLMKKILSSKIVFFDISPIGRILNRFSSDTYTIDDSLPFIINILLAQFFGLLGSIIITTYGIPWLCLLLVPLVPVYHYIQSTYRCAARELKRLSSTSLSPIYNHFNETLQGLITIRSFRCLSRFRRMNEEYLENNQKAVFASQAANQWLDFRLQMIGVVIVTGVGTIAVLQHEFDVIDSAVVGLTVSYALSITALLNGVVSAFTEAEKEMISLERIGQYVEEIESETEKGGNPPYGWLSQGVIVFQSVYLKYREHTPLSLNGVSFESRPAEKIGVVGRTGAGKSSLIVALLRLVELSSGRIIIDAVNIGQLSLQALRSRISVIPQDPFLFEGTVRENVDPLGEFNDGEIWSALQKCYIKTLIEVLGGLDAKILAGGRNFSQGQRQLLCLARAVLKNAKIVCVDEATASVDPESDKKIQHTIRSSFRQSTVIMIAHRISTIMDCDRILVLSDGEVVEFDSPKTLALDETSYFYKLCQKDI